MCHHSSGLRSDVFAVDFNTRTTSAPKPCNPAPAYAAILLMLAAGCGEQGEPPRVRIEKAQAQVRRIAEDLDKRTTETGVYIRVKEADIKEIDPWGTSIKVTYAQGGVAETVTVRSAGPDREFQTNDDITAGGMSANLKGIGEGIKKNAEQAAANVAKGAVKGTVAGVKESIKESLPFKKKTESGEGKPKPEKEQ